MANTIVTPDVIATQALLSLEEQLVMQPLVYTDVTSDFASARVGDTINIRKPAVFESKKFVRASGIEIQDATESKVPVTVDQFDTVDFEVTSEDFMLSIDDLDERLITPAAFAIATGVDQQILTLRDDITQEVGVIVPNDVYRTREYTNPRVLVGAGGVLNAAKVPQSERRAVIGPEIQAAWLDTDDLQHVNTSGTTEALREAYLGRRLSGFDPYWTQNVARAEAPAPGAATTEVGVAFHRTAFAFASAPMLLPPGAEGAVQSRNGLNIRVTWAYDINRKATVFSLDILYGVKTLDKNRAVLIKGADAGGSS